MLRKQEMSRKNQWLVLIGLMMLALMSFTLPAAAYSRGMLGYSGINGTTCSACHSGSIDTPGTLAGVPTSATPGTTYTLTFSGATAILGMDVAVTGGTLIAGAAPENQSSSTEIDTTSAIAQSWTFQWTAPSTAGNVTIYAAGVDGMPPSTTYTAAITIPVAGSPPPPVVSVSISPTSASLLTGGTQQFTATVTGSTNTAVTWSGTGVSSTGLFTAPSTAGSYTVTATSAADPTKSASATVTVTAPTVVSVSISPTSASLTTGGTQQFSATVTGNSNTSVTWSGTGVSSTGLFTAPSTAGTYTVRATSAADTTKSASATVTVTAPTVVSVSISPTSASLTTGGTQQFTATVTGNSNTSVTWSGTGVSSTGLFTAPSTAGTYTVRATSAADPTKSASATVTVTGTLPPTSVGSITVSPSQLVFYANSTSSIAAQTIAVTTSSTTAVSFTVATYGCDWISVPSYGTTSSTQPGNITVTANGTGLTAGTYACVIQFTSGSSVRRVPVVLVVGSSSSAAAAPFTFDPGMLQAVSAGWLSGAGEVLSGSSDTQGLVLSKKPTGGPNA
jgi:hypothetical protein